MVEVVFESAVASQHNSKSFSLTSSNIVQMKSTEQHKCIFSVLIHGILYLFEIGYQLIFLGMMISVG